LKTLNKYLISKNIGKIDIKTKGFNESVENFRKKLKLKGNNTTTIFIVRIKQEHLVLFVEKI
jgi:diaminopimelate epimerase